MRSSPTLPLTLTAVTSSCLLWQSRSDCNTKYRADEDGRDQLCHAGHSWPISSSLTSCVSPSYFRRKSSRRYIADRSDSNIEERFILTIKEGITARLELNKANDVSSSEMAAVEPRDELGQSADTLNGAWNIAASVWVTSQRVKSILHTNQNEHHLSLLQLIFLRLGDYMRPFSFWTSGKEEGSQTGSLDSLSIPFSSLRDSRLDQPFFAATSWRCTLTMMASSHRTSDTASLILTFNHGRAHEFIQALETAIRPSQTSNQIYGQQGGEDLRPFVHL